MRVCSASGVTSDITISSTRFKHPVGHGLAHQHAGDLVHHGRDALQVLHVHGGDHVDLVVEQLEDIFVALVVLAALDVGVRQLVHQHDLRMARQNGVHVHLFEERAFVVDLLARHRLQARGHFLRRLAAVGLDHSDDHVFAATLAADGLAQHGIGLADARARTPGTA